MKLPVQIRQVLDTLEPPELGPGPRPGVRSIPSVEDHLGRCPLPDSRRELIRATALLWHDHLDAAHGIVQDIETADGSYLHAILHRREPDYANARYWFRRVGLHACHPELAARTVKFLRSSPALELASRLVPRGRWDAIRFVDLCETASRDPGREAEVLRGIQQIEFSVLMEHFCQPD
jgi:hypothetical protein